MLLIIGSLSCGLIFYVGVLSRGGTELMAFIVGGAIWALMIIAFNLADIADSLRNGLTRR